MKKATQNAKRYLQTKKKKKEIFANQDTHKQFTSKTNKQLTVW